MSARRATVETTDPKPSKDGSCASCRRQRRLQGHNTQYGDLSRELAADPFCSSRCANKWYGVHWQGDKRDDRFDHRSRLKPAA